MLVYCPTQYASNVATSKKTILAPVVVLDRIQKYGKQFVEISHSVTGEYLGLVASTELIRVADSNLTQKNKLQIIERLAKYKNSLILRLGKNFRGLYTFDLEKLSVILGISVEVIKLAIQKKILSFLVPIKSRLTGQDLRETTPRTLQGKPKRRLDIPADNPRPIAKQLIRQGYKARQRFRQFCGGITEALSLKKFRQVVGAPKQGKRQIKQAARKIKLIGDDIFAAHIGAYMRAIHPFCAKVNENSAGYNNLGLFSRI